MSGDQRKTGEVPTASAVKWFAAVLLWSLATASYWGRATTAIVIGWVLIGVWAYRINKRATDEEDAEENLIAEQERLLQESRERDEAKRRELLGRLATGMHQLEQRDREPA
jgi:uncharacterized membrane-anchored protein YhcB (DUF1043 family)